MAFLRFNRDTRGYEYFCLVQQTTNRRGKVRPRLLYWFRTPPNLKVGRQPFDDAVQRALEAQNPDIHFDWPAILDTPIPPPVEPERWRERRRLERAARQAATEEIQDLEAGPVVAAEPHEPGSASSTSFDLTTENGEAVEHPSDERVTEGTDVRLKPAAADGAAARLLDIVRRKRRRRGRRGRSIATGGSAEPAVSGSAAAPQIEPIEPPDAEED
jgi:hypothetical protein